jgi:hypothetical protein
VYAHDFGNARRHGNANGFACGGEDCTAHPHGGSVLIARRRRPHAAVENPSALALVNHKNLLLANLKSQPQ